MATRPSRPLPTPYGPVNLSVARITIYPLHRLSISNPRSCSRPEYPPGSSVLVDEEQPTATLREGTLVYKGFYDLIPTPSPSRMLWGAGADPPPDVVAGP
jgi:protein-serine/threonine kinase